MKKKMLMAALLLVTTVSVLMAQGGGQKMPPEDRAKSTVERLKPELSLTDQQAKDITPIYTEFYTTMGKLFENGTRPSPEDRQKMIDDRNEKLKKILSDDQMKKLADAEEKMRQERRQQGGGNGGK